MNLYKDLLLDHYKNPRNYGKLKNPTISSGEHIPSCGDSVEIECIIIDDILCEIGFTGKGCIISQATASMLTEFCKQKNINELLKLDDAFILNLIGIELGPNRLKCALLPLMPLQKCIRYF
ncbi:MAG: iron-sulfur cluster assembly scaffold protein [Candidatus Babeliales bacterium]|nr:iron-sulfur cluster assembly scaffold protein [Candidatus Babeliales bacterium]